MTPNELFYAALQLRGTAWKVTGCTFCGEPRKLQIELGYDRGSLFPCPLCGELSPVYDTVEKRWRHLNFFQYQCDLVAKVPRVSCAKDGIRQVEVPWASAGSGFTLMFEAFVMLLVEQMPVSDVAELVGESDTRLWRLIQRLVDQAHAKSDWSRVRAIAVDETSARRGRKYVTVILDAETRKVLFLEQGRDSNALKKFCHALEQHGGSAEQIRWVAMDMLHCYAKGVRENFPNAKIIYDRYHLMVMAGEAVDEVRKQLKREGADLKGAMWPLRGNEWNLTEEYALTRARLTKAYKPLGRALSLRTALQDVLEAPEDAAEENLRWWCQWATRSRLAPFQKLARTIRMYWHGIINYFQTRITQGAVEAINGIIQLAKRRARGFRNFTYLRTIAYLTTGKLDLDLPSVLPT